MIDTPRTHLPVDLARRVGRTVALTACLGALAFLVGVVLHPGRTGWEIASAPQYAIVHELIALGVAVQLAALVGYRILFAERLGRRAWAFWLVFAGQLLWLALIVFDGSHNPLMARLAPEIVHTPADADGATLLFVLPALLVFPAGHVAWSVALGRARLLPAWPLVLSALGAVAYSFGGDAIFLFGPASPVVAAAEISGAALFGVGFASAGLLVSRRLDVRQVAPALGRTAAAGG